MFWTTTSPWGLDEAVYVSLYSSSFRGTPRRNRIWRDEFKSWTRLIAFHIALIRFEKVWIQLFSFPLWVNSRADYVHQIWRGNQSKRRKDEFKTVKLRLKFDLVSCPAPAEGLVNIYTRALRKGMNPSFFPFSNNYGWI